MRNMVTESKRIFPVLAALFVMLLAVLAPFGVSAQDKQQTTRAQPEAATGWQDKAPVIAQKQMVVVAHPLAANTARDILRKGGSAVDAAIAAQLVLNLVEPQSSGLGGGGFLVHWDAKGKALTTFGLDLYVRPSCCSQARI